MNLSSLRIRPAHLAWVLALLLSAAPAHAVISCSASMTGLSFGTVNPLSSQSNASAAFSYQCSSSALLSTYSALVCFSIGEPGGGATNPRLMSSGANRLQFQLYQDPARTNVWGSQMFGTFRTPLTVAVTVPAGRIVSGTATLYGQVLANQNTAVPGNYQDNYQSGDTALTINEALGSNAPGTCSNTNTAGFPFLVSAVVEKRCTVTAGTVSDIDLGTVPASATNVPGSGSIGVTCSNTTPYYVGLRPSNNSSTGAGVMAATGVNTDKVPYQLYQDAGMTSVWGSTATATSPGNGVAGTGTGATQSLGVFVRAPSADFQPDSYSDTVTVLINY